MFRVPVAHWRCDPYYFYPGLRREERAFDLGYAHIFRRKASEYMRLLAFSQPKQKHFLILPAPLRSRLRLWIIVVVLFLFKIRFAMGVPDI
jgi:hypothetical protein